jgi:hypothetical protein
MTGGHQVMNPIVIKSGPKPISRQEAEARQRAREARLRKSMKFPWVRMLVSMGAAMGLVLMLGGGLLALVITVSIAGALTKGRGAPGFFGRPRI